MNGSGILYSLNYEKHKWYWMVAYFLLGVMHLAIACKYWKQVNIKMKYIILLITLGIYFYLVMKF